MSYVKLNDRECSVISTEHIIAISKDCIDTSIDVVYAVPYVTKPITVCLEYGSTELLLKDYSYMVEILS